MHSIGHIRTIETRNVRVVVDACEECSPDISFDETNETRDKINSGEWVIFCARARCFVKGIEVATDYLGNCIYPSFADFKAPGGYFGDMVRTVLHETRSELRDLRSIHIR